jgi:broad specificity phosphatase PhoE
MKAVFIARHGETTWNAERRWAGSADPPLSDRGRAQALEAASALGGLGFECIASSALQRARETARIIGDALGIALCQPLNAFNERNFGMISGMTSPEIEARYPGLLDPWRAGFPIEPPGAEPWRCFVGRCVAALLALPPGRTLVIAHEGVLRAIADHLGEKGRKYANLEGRWISVTDDHRVVGWEAG